MCDLLSDTAGLTIMSGFLSKERMIITIKYCTSWYRYFLPVLLALIDLSTESSVSI